VSIVNFLSVTAPLFYFIFSPTYRRKCTYFKFCGQDADYEFCGTCGFNYHRVFVGASDHPVLHREMGVFVSTDIEHDPSQALLDYTGEVGNKLTCSPYAITLSAHSLVIDASYLRCFASMINDPSGSDQSANVEFRPYKTSDKHKIRLGVFTLRRIRAGEELLASYGVQPSTVGIEGGVII